MYIKKFRCIVGILLLASAMTSIVFAEGAKETSQRKNSDRKTISVLLRSSESGEPYRVWQPLFDEFAEKHNLKVEYELIPNDADYANKLQLYISSNQLPDFYGCANGTFSKAALSSGQLVNVGQELKDMGKFDMLNKAVVDFLTDSDDGNMYLLPQGLYCEFFFYRKDIFEQYGLEIPKTWSDFTKVCEVLKEKNITPVVVGGKDNWQLMRYLSFIPWRVTHDGFIYDYIEGSDSFMQNAYAHAGVELLHDMGTKGYFQIGFTSTNYSDSVNLFFGGTGAMYYAGTGMISNASEMFADGKLGIFPVPDMQGVENISTNVPIHAGFGFGFNAETYDDTMKEFLSFAMDNFSKACYDAGIFSPLKDEVPEGLDPLFYEIKSLFDDAKQSWVSWDDKLDSATLTSMGDEQQELALGMISPKQFESDMDNVIEANR